MPDYKTHFVDLKSGQLLAQEFVDEWDALLTRCEDSVQLFTANWFVSWLNTIGSNGRWVGQARIVYVTENTTSDTKHRIVGLTVLAKMKIFKIIPVWSFGGYYQPWRSIIADHAHAVAVGESIARFVRTRFLMILQAGPMNIALNCNKSFLENLKSKKLPFHSSDVQLCVYNCSISATDYTSKILGKKLTKNIRYYKNRLSSEGTVEIAHYSSLDGLKTDQILADLSIIENNSWLVTSKTGLPRFIRSTDRQFWHQVLVSSCIPKQQFDTWVLYFDEKPISFCLTLTSSTTRFIIANQFDDKFSKYMTGSILYEEMMLQGISQGVSKFDFGDGGIDYKKKWGAIEADLKSTTYVTSSTILSILMKALISLKNIASIRPS